MPIWPKRISILARTASTTLAREATLYRKLHTEHRWSACPGRILLVEQQVLSSDSLRSQHSYSGDIVSHPNTELTRRVLTLAFSD